jgi:hypothetical protein
MPNTKRNIADIARDYAEGSELAAATNARVPIAPMQGKSREAWVRRWLDLSDWAQIAELKELDRELAETLEEHRLRSEDAERQAAEAMYTACHAETSFRQLVERHDPDGTSELARHFAETQLARDGALEAACIVARNRSDYSEAKGIVAVAQTRVQHAQHHFAEMRRVRIRAVASTILVTLVLLTLSVLLVQVRTRLR